MASQIHPVSLVCCFYSLVKFGTDNSIDISSPTNGWTSPWTFTDPAVGNRWEEVEEDDNSEDGSPAPKKRKQAALTQGQGGGQVAKGKDFGASKNMLSSGWKEYTNETSSRGIHP
ncbi:hypothetical protein B0H13DRAFT_1873188 [Mycena leptocephala]|nr:hypothetical protein B0H13DRAFT_1873188 [Mycena leptocephala]